MTNPLGRFTQTGNRSSFTDADGDEIHVTPINSIALGRLGPSIYVQTSEPGCFVPLDTVEEFVTAVRDAATHIAHAVGRQCTDTDCGPCSFDHAFSAPTAVEG